jgi:hypothetical protein
VFKLSKLLFALLAVMAMLLFAPGTAVADETNPTPEECASEAPPAACPVLDAGDGMTGDEGDGTGDDGGVIEPEMVIPAVTAEDPVPCTDPTDIEGCVPDCEDELFQDLPICQDPPSLPDCEDPTQLPDCLPDCEDPQFAELPVCDPPAPPDCETPDDLPDCLPDCEDPQFADLPICDLPPCETPEDLPLCTPDCEFVASLLGLDGCELPAGECLDLSQLPAEIQDILDQLPPELLDALPICPVEPPDGGGPPPPPVVAPVGNPDPYYENCDDARAQGAAPVYEGEPGYRPELDSDHDGIGCEDDGVTTVSDNGQLAYTGVELEPLLRGGAILLSSGTLLLLFGARRRT